MSAPAQPRQPWPMKWIILAIVLTIVPYTVLTLRYRKEGPAFQPYEDLRNRANVSRLLAAGYQRIPITAQRPADSARAAGGATTTARPGGLPADLKDTHVEPIQLPSEIGSVTTAASTSHDREYAIQLACTLPDDRHQLGGAHVYVRGTEIVIAPTFESVAGGLVTRSRQAAVLLTLPANALRPGRYEVTLVGERASRGWVLEVR